MVILLRGIDLNPDPRVEKYVQFYERNDISYRLVGWNRSGNNIEKKNTIFFNLRAEYGAKEKNLVCRIKWTFFIIKVLLRERKNYSVIHACDYDTAIPSILMKLFKKKVIFDVFDWINEEKESKLVSIINKLQIFAANRSDSIIICDEMRKKQMNIKNENIYVLPNIPSGNICFGNNDEPDRSDSNKTIISYVGVFDYNRNIEELLRYVSIHKKVELRIAGFGALEDKILSYAKNNDNITFYGKVDYQKGLEIMYNSDIIYAMYSKINKNHIFAAPNKYYEAMMLGKAILTTKGTLVGENVEKNKIGFAINENYNELEELLNERDLDERIEFFSKNSKRLWEIKFKYYVDNFMNNTYLNLLK